MKIDDVGIVGFGRFGKVLADIMDGDFGIHVYSHYPVEVRPGSTINEATLEQAASCSAVFFSVQMRKFKRSLEEALPFLNRGSVVIDVCSVKLYPVQIMKELLPDGTHMLPTHPMFGPDSVGDGLKGLPMVFCTENTPADVAAYWMKYFRSKNLKVVEMNAEQHDRITAYSLCLTQFLGRIISRMGVISTEIDMQSFKNLMQMKEISCNDSFELLQDLSTLNPYAREMRAHFKKELLELEKLLDQ
jgi:prephenate dehydrogenase